jgi:hypothetical protein
MNQGMSMRNLTFSLTFPNNHPRRGQFTQFLETIRTGEKKQTVRSHKPNNQLKKDDRFNPMYWSGRPYHSKMVAICEPLIVTKTLPFEKNGLVVKVDNQIVSIDDFSRDDGLTTDDFLGFFPEVFYGYVIYW